MKLLLVNQVRLHATELWENKLACGPLNALASMAVGRQLTCTASNSTPRPCSEMRGRQNAHYSKL